jgi:hypothetical protein
MSLVANMLDARSVMEFQVLLDLGLPPPFRRLVQRKLDSPVAVCHDLRHQRGIFSRDVFIVEVLVERKTHHRGIEVYPTVHLVPAYVAHYVVDMQQACGTSQVIVRLANVPG